jgi:hypothetical protein
MISGLYFIMAMLNQSESIASANTLIAAAAAYASLAS